MPGPRAEKKNRFRAALHRPVKWLRGEGLPEGQVRPWEQGAYIAEGAVAGLRNGFAWNVMYLFQNVFKINKDLQAVGQVTKGVWDGLNDPVIGAWMDNKGFPIALHRKIVRIASLFASPLTILLFFKLGPNLTDRPWAHIILYIAVNMIQDLFNTARDVSKAKIWAHITPYSQQRDKIAWAYSFGQTLHEALGGMIWVILGLRDVLGWPEYTIYLLGGIVTTLPGMLTDMLPSFVLQRVPDTPPPERQGDFWGEIKESFYVMKHNRFFWLHYAGKLLQTFVPSVSDQDFYRYCGAEGILSAGSAIKGEFWFWIYSNVASAPGMLIQPFTLRIMKKIGGARSAMIACEAVAAAVGFSRLIPGVATLPGILFLWGSQMVVWTFMKVNFVAEQVVKYDMFDYVEWKTGRRSEGVYTAMEGLVKKITVAQLETVVGSLFLKRVGFNPLLDQNQPASYITWAVRFYLLAPPIKAAIMLVARILYKYPEALKHQVEAELIERRRLAENTEKELAEV